MNQQPIKLVQPLAYRVWDPRHHSFFYTDVRPEPTPLLDRWTGHFDKQGSAIYENDILRVHYDWKFGWIRALVVRLENRNEYIARATGPDGTHFQIAFYSFSDAYRIGNLREHPHKLIAASEQFSHNPTEPWWLCTAIFRSVPRSCFN